MQRKDGPYEWVFSCRHLEDVKDFADIWRKKSSRSSRLGEEELGPA